MSDEEKRQLVNEFRDPQTIEFRRVVIAKRLLEDIMQRECPRLIARHESGRALYDEDLALLVYYYQDRLDENLKKLIAERNIPQIDSERYISEYFEERIHKQVALFAIKESAVRLVAESAIKTAVQTTTKSGFSFVSQFFSISKSVWTINFAVGAGMMLVDLGHSLRLWWKGEITGIGLIKRMTSSLASNSLGLGGGTIGAILGAFLGPLGALAGSLIGGLLGALFGKLVNDLFWRLFEEDPEIAREKLLQGARDVLGVMRKDNFTIITQKWRSMILLTHPDKNPNADSEEKKNLEKKFCEVHTSYKILKAEMERQGKLSKKQFEEISKTSPVQVINDGWLDY